MFNLLIAAIVLIEGHCTHGLPSYVHTCSRDDPYLENCLINTFNALRPFARNGIEELNLPSLNPLVVERFIASQEISLINYTFSAWNFTVHGIDNYNIKEIKYDSSINETFRIKVDFESVNLTSEYQMEGSLANIPIAGEGMVQTDLATANATFVIIGEIRNSSKGEYYRVKDVNVKMKIRSSYFHFNGLFNNHEGLEMMTNRMINGNKQMIADALTPILEILTEKGIMRFMKSLTKAFSYQELLPRLNN